MAILVASLLPLKRGLDKAFTNMNLYNQTYVDWVDAIINVDLDDELEFRLRDDAICYTDHERTIIVKLVERFITETLRLPLDNSITYDLSVRGSNIICLPCEDRRDTLIARLRKENAELSETNTELTLLVEAYEQ